MLRAAWVFFLGVLSTPPAVEDDVFTGPLSATKVAQLVEQVADRRVGPRWVEALGSPQPEIRAAAARGILVTGARPLVPALRKALQAESDPKAGREEASAVILLGDPADARAGLAASQRFGEMTLAARWLLRRLGSEFATELPNYWDGDLPIDGRSLARLTGKDAAVLNRLTTLGVEKARPELLAGALRAAIASRSSLDTSVLARGVASTSVEVRRAIFQYLCQSISGGIDAGLRAAVDASPEGRGTRDDAKTLFYFALLRRRLGLPEKGPSLVDLGSAIGPWDAEDRVSLVPLLRESERTAISQALYGRGDSLDPEERTHGEEPARLPMQTVRELPTGLVGDAMGTFGCVPGEPAILYAADIIYRPDGRAGHITLLGDFERASPCSRVARVLLTNAIAPADFVPGRKEMVILPIDLSLLGCLVARNPPPTIRTQAHEADDQGGPARVGGHIKEPRKLRNVKPIYPLAAKNRRVQGIVVLEATISPTGCIQTIDALRSPEPQLSVEAIRAVAGWTYTPTLLNGVPVPVIMTVTVNFRLN